MKYLDEFRDPLLVEHLIERISALTSRQWTMMEVCGGQTHSLIRHGIDQLLPSQIELIHGPGCPVCVTPSTSLDEAIAIARLPGVTLCTFADMLRVPGSESDLLAARAAGAAVREVYSPLEAVALAATHPEEQIVFFAVGFETTAPANAMSVLQAEALGLENFSLLTSQVLVPPAITAILEAPDNRVEAFLAAGHVCTVMGVKEYEPIASHYHVPIAVTGFEPVDLLLGIESCVRQLEAGEAGVDNQYARCVRNGGNPAAVEAINRVFELTTREWRGMGSLQDSGLGLNGQYARFDARRRFPVDIKKIEDDRGCLAGDVLTGRVRPDQCPHFGEKCRPDSPVGAPMVSAEGACAAYYMYGRGTRNQHSKA